VSLYDRVIVRSEFSNSITLVYRKARGLA